MVLIAIFKRSDNVLPLITLCFPIIFFHIYSNWLIIIFCLPLFFLSPFFLSLTNISHHIYSNWLFIIFCLPLFFLSPTFLSPCFQLFLSSNSYLHKNSRQNMPPNFFSYFNSFPSMIILICRVLVNSTMNLIFFFFI